jgi:hypothetical protein
MDITHQEDQGGKHIARFVIYLPFTADTSQNFGNSSHVPAADLSWAICIDYPTQCSSGKLLPYDSSADRQIRFSLQSANNGNLIVGINKRAFLRQQVLEKAVHGVTTRLIGEAEAVVGAGDRCPFIAAGRLATRPRLLA